MIYLRVTWLDATDEDLFRFTTLDKAILYIKEEGLINYVVTDSKEYAEIGVLYHEDDYSFIN